MNDTLLKIPEAPNSIAKGVPLKYLLDKAAIEQLANNIGFAYPDFDNKLFASDALNGIDALKLSERAAHIALSLRKFLPNNYTKSIEIILKSLTPPLVKTENNGLASMFYLPHASFISKYGLNKSYNKGIDPFEVSMHACYELTMRFTSEFCIRPFLIDQQERTLSFLHKWLKDTNPHVRRLCSEGTRPRLPWAMRLPAFIKDPTPILPILEQLKNDDSLYVRRSVANHLGDIAKDHPNLILDICQLWLKGASSELKWVIRHALRYPAKKENERAIALRLAAK